MAWGSSYSHQSFCMTVPLECDQTSEDTNAWTVYLPNCWKHNDFLNSARFASLQEGKSTCWNLPTHIWKIATDHSQYSKLYIWWSFEFTLTPSIYYAPDRVIPTHLFCSFLPALLKKKNDPQGTYSTELLFVNESLLVYRHLMHFNSMANSLLKWTILLTQSAIRSLLTEVIACLSGLVTCPDISQYNTTSTILICHQ